MLLMKFNKKIRKFLDWYAWWRLQRMEEGELWRLLEDYKKKTHFSGVYYYKYLKLYTTIKTKKFKEILECGSGVSTVIIAFALKKNGGGRVTSMEEHTDEYYEQLLKIFPNELREFVDFHSSPKILDYYGLFCGVRYTKVPERVYDFVFIDGPSTGSPLNKQYTFDFDFIFVLLNFPIKEICALVDNRKSTVWVLRHILGDRKVRYHHISNLGYVKTISKKDLRESKQFVQF